MSEVKIWPWAKDVVIRYWGWILCIGLVALVEAGVSVTIPITWQGLIDRAVGGRMDYGLAGALLAIMCLDTLPALSVLRERLISRQCFDLRGRVFLHMLRLSVPFFRTGSSDNGKSAQVALEVNQGVESGERLLRIFLKSNLLSSLPTAAFGLVFVASFSPAAAAILVGFLAVFVVLSSFLGKRVGAVAAAHQKLDVTIAARQLDIMKLVETVKLHQAESYERDWYEERGQKLMQLEWRMNWLSGWLAALDGLSGALPFCVSLALFLPGVVDGQLSVGMLVALQLYSARAVAPAGFLGEMYQEIKRHAATLKPMLELLRQRPVVVESTAPVVLQPVRHEIAFRNVTFSYPDVSEPSLYDVTLTIQAGQKIAVVGRTASGKSTLARILARFYDPQHGLITLDGVDLRQVSFESLYHEVCYVTQEASVLSGTVGENVGYGLRGCAEERIAAACRSAAADFAILPPRGLHTPVGESGCQLSGGERQRIALARVFLRHPSVIILDEATASLDQLTEREILATFDELVHRNGGTTAVVIEHRMSTVKTADQVIVMDAGRVVDVGTHETLLGRCALYRALCQEKLVA